MNFFEILEIVHDCDFMIMISWLWLHDCVFMIVIQVSSLRFHVFDFIYLSRNWLQSVDLIYLIDNIYVAIEVSQVDDFWNPTRPDPTRKFREKNNSTQPDPKFAGQKITRPRNFVLTQPDPVLFFLPNPSRPERVGSGRSG